MLAFSLLIGVSGCLAAKCGTKLAPDVENSEWVVLIS